MNSVSDGLILLSSTLEIIYVNAAALEVLGFPENSQKTHPADPQLRMKVKSLLAKEPSPDAPVVTSLKSGRRTYRCRAFKMQSEGNGHSLTLAILIERGVKSPFDTTKLADQFRLTQREQETVNYLLQGLSSKEIADRMQISPNTVKAFLRLIMVKMGTTTRYGILGKIFEATQ
jgi:DNA-binding CsgD family transcriptional regulator